MKQSLQTEKNSFLNAIYNLKVSLHKRFLNNKGNKRNTIGTLKKKKLTFYLLFSMLPILHFIVFYIIVNFNSILMSFQEYDYYSGVYNWVGIENFKNVLNDFINLNFFRFAFRNSIIFYFVLLLFGSTLCLLFSYYIYKKAKFSEFFKVLLFIPVIISNVALVTVFKYFSEVGVPVLIDKIFNIHIDGLISNNSTVFYVLLFFNIWSGFGVPVIMYSGAMSAISDSVVESAKLDGVNAFQEFIYITFPLIYNTFMTFLIVGLAGIFVNQRSIYSFFGNVADYSVYTIGYYLYRNTLDSVATLKDFPYIATVGLILTLILLPIVLIIRKILEKYGPSLD
jgi:ABC-type sugar transport system permease subunit